MVKGTNPSAKQSSAELMVTSYPSHPYKSKPSDPLPHPHSTSSALDLVPLAQKIFSLGGDLF